MPRHRKSFLGPEVPRSSGSDFLPARSNSRAMLGTKQFGLRKLLQKTFCNLATEKKVGELGEL